MTPQATLGETAICTPCPRTGLRLTNPGRAPEVLPPAADGYAHAVSAAPKVREGKHETEQNP